MKGAGCIGVVHVHSDYSHDGLDSLERLRAVSLERGLGFVALADHAEDLDAERFREYRERCRALSDEKLTLIPGLEFRFAGFRGLHLLALGLERWIEPRTPQEFVQLTCGAAGLTVVAHPILAGYWVPEAVLAGVDAIEVWNAAYNTRYLPDPVAIRLLHAARRRRPEVVGVAGLDQHNSANDRRTRILLSREDAADPLAALRAGRFRNAGLTLSFDPAAGWGPAGLAALGALRWGLDRVERVQERVALRLRRRGERP